MKVRYCQENNFNNPPCPVGWGSAHSDQGSICHIESCLDDPKEKYCRYLVDDKPEIEYCPTCGTVLGIKDDKPSK